eukprot:423581_1
MDSLKAMHTISRLLQEELNRNANDIAHIKNILTARRKGFGKLIQKAANTSSAMSLQLHDAIMYSLKQKAQTQQFGEFLSDLDMKTITKDYHHILKVHIHE